ncbi:hypothetical protein ACCC92_03065 [Mucilaginibacter sp. Mucisp84]|uniref:hypothetical protein n=1 Tax=Mucilaginibacter sp. Mucisp84 TaxID=3243058 RepID=UPI0039A5912A
MNQIKTLADQLRDKMAKPDTPLPEEKPVKKRTAKPEAIPPIVEQLRAYDLSDHKNAVHARFDGATAQTLHHFKMATGIEVTRLICYAVRQLLEQNPEIKSIVKQYIQKLEL